MEKVWNASLLGKEESCEWLWDEKDWMDITEEMSRFRTSLEENEMVSCDSFDLFDSMSALEVLVEKMDPRFQAFNIKPMEELLTIACERVLSLSENEKSALIDTFIRHESSYWSGQAISHSIFVFVFTHFPQQCPCPLLRAYTLATMHCSQFLASIIHTAEVCAEEDFITFLFDRDLTAGVDTEQVLEMLDQFIQECEGRLKLQMCMRRDLLAFLYGLVGNTSFYRNLTKELHFVENILGYISRMEQHPPVELDDSVVDTFFINDLGKTMLTAQPPRIIDACSLKDALNIISSLCKNLLQLANDFIKVPERYETIDLLFELYSSLSTSFNSDIISRSISLLVLGTELDFLDKGLLTDYIKHSIIRFCPPCKNMIRKIDQDLWNEFVHRSSSLVCVSLSLQCYNRSRQRRKLPLLLKEWSILQRDAYHMDKMNGGENRLFSWVFEHSLRYQILYLSLGLEFQLYSTQELISVYWNLEYFYWIRSRNAFVAGHQILEKAKSKKNKKVNSDPVPPRPSSSTLYVEASFHLCRAIRLMILHLHRLDLISFREFPFGSEELRYQHRFKAFNQMFQPLSRSFQEFQASIEELKNVELQTEIIQSLKQAKNMFSESIRLAGDDQAETDRLDKKSLMKVCVSNTVFLLSKRQSNPVQLKWSVHKCFPTFS